MEMVHVEWRLKSCPKCGGSLHYEYDGSDKYGTCLQCGYVHNLNVIFDQNDGVSDRGRGHGLRGLK